VKLLTRYARAVERMNDGIGVALRWLALAMVLMGAYNAVARYLTRWAGVSLSSNALNELQWYAFSLIFLLGAAYGLRHDVHVRVDVLFNRLSERGRAWVDIVGTVFFLIPFSVLMLWVSWPMVRASWAVRETSPDPGGLSRYPIKAVILICFLLLLLQGLAHLVRQVEILRRRDAVEREDRDGDDGLLPHRGKA
jgi:TRAP-type mannitol/chloroaromatic compound transport system permease small subunit